MKIKWLIIFRKRRLSGVIKFVKICKQTVMKWYWNPSYQKKNSYFMIKFIMRYNHHICLKFFDYEYWIEKCELNIKIHKRREGSYRKACSIWCVFFIYCSGRFKLFIKMVRFSLRWSRFVSIPKKLKDLPKKFRKDFPGRL